MNIKHLLYLLIATIVCYSCNISNNKKDNTESSNTSSQLIDNSGTSTQIWKFDSLTLDKKYYVNNDTSKLGIAVDILLKYPVSAPPNVDLENVQKAFAKLLSKEDNLTLSPKETFHTVLKKNTSDALEYLKDANDGDVHIPDFEYSMGNNIDSITNDIITTSVGYYTYLGGAHGSYYLKYYNIDIHNGDIINEKLLFKNNYKEKLTSLIQNAIAKLNSSPNEDDHLYLLVELTEVVPNDNFYFGKNGLVYVFNQYEIAPYAQGIPEVTLSYSEVRSIIKDQYQYIIKNRTEK